MAQCHFSLGSTNTSLTLFLGIKPDQGWGITLLLENMNLVTGMPKEY